MAICRKAMEFFWMDTAAEATHGPLCNLRVIFVWYVEVTSCTMLRSHRMYDLEIDLRKWSWSWWVTSFLHYITLLCVISFAYFVIINTFWGKRTGTSEYIILHGINLLYHANLTYKWRYVGDHQLFPLHLVHGEDLAKLNISPMILHFKVCMPWNWNLNYR